MNENLAGAFAGAATVIGGYPFDTLKTWRQTKHIEKPTIRSLYRGITGPLLGQTIIASSLFGIDNKFHSYGYNHFQSGFASGFLSSFIISPIELVKVRQQNKLPLKTVKPWLGLGTTMARESPAACIFFGSYHYQKEYYKEKKLNVPAFIPGGVAGLLSWACTYPIDVIKSRVQSSLTIKEAIQQKNFSKGFMMCMIRATVANAIAFTVYEFFIKVL